MDNSNPAQGTDPQALQNEYARIAVSLRQLEEQMNAIESQLGMISNNIEMYEIAKKTVENIKDLEEGAEVLFPIGDIVLAKAKILDPKNFIVNIGADISMEKDAQGAIAYLDKNIELLNNTIVQIQEEAKKVIQQIQMLEGRKNEIARSLGGPQVPSG
ncbi:MAG: prefoldin subunit alpha [Promethearchaeota archaeon]|nr:MAG: prefoldin subunit alpha [Candidatus Lokiarchaeota archaeon]